MPHLHSHAESRARTEAMRADRARGMTFTVIAKVHQCSRSLAFRAARDVHILSMWNRWHLARWCKPDTSVQPVLRQVHELRSRGQW
jgi:hypothetical protein